MGFLKPKMPPPPPPAPTPPPLPPATADEMTMEDKVLIQEELLKKKKEMPSDIAKTKKKLLQKQLATDPTRRAKMNRGGLKMPTADQTGLRKLPTAVRNKMGYMYGGGMANKSRTGSMDYRKGGLIIISIDMKKKKKGKK